MIRANNTIQALKIAAFFLAGIFSLPFSVSAQSLTLESAIEAAMQNNERIKQYGEKLRQKEYQNIEAWGNFLPSIVIEGGYTHLNDEMSIDLNPIKDVIITLQGKNQAEIAGMGSVLQGKPPFTQAQKDAYAASARSQLSQAIPSFSETFKKQNYKTATVLGVQPIFTGGRLLAAKKYAAEEKLSAEIELKKTRNEIVQETVNQYLGIVLLQNVVKTRQDVLSGIIRHRNNAQKLLNEGLIANYHLLRAEVAVADAERALGDDQNKLELAFLSLRNTLGIDSDGQLAIKDTLVFSNISEPLTSLLARATEEQPLLLLIGQKKKAAEIKYTAERAGFLPTIAAFGKYELYPEYLSNLEPRWAVGLQFKYNLFNGFRDYAKLQNAVHTEREVSLIESEARKKIDLWINKAYRDMRNAETRYEKTAKSILLAAENLRLNEKRFQSGMGTSLEVIDAQLSMEKNRIESLYSLYEYYRSATDLFTAAGNPAEIIKIWHKEK